MIKLTASVLINIALLTPLFSAVKQGDSIRISFHELTAAAFGLLVLIILILLAGFYLGKFIARLQLKDEIKAIRRDSVNRSRSVITGNVAEQIAPYLPGFPYNPQDARFIGKPVDFIVFNGSGSQNIEEVIFVEVKTGKSSLNASERQLKECILQKKVKWFEYRLDTGNQSR